jgi:rhodanese-related sulfurtransferase
VTIRFNLLDPSDLPAALAAARAPILVDVRERAAFEAGHIPGSRNVWVYDLGAERAALPANLAERLIVISDHRKRAQAAANFLTLIGFGDVAVLEGGIATYAGPIETGPAPESAPRRGPQLRVVDADDGAPPSAESSSPTD